MFSRQRLERRLGTQTVGEQVDRHTYAVEDMGGLLHLGQRGRQILRVASRVGAIDDEHLIGQVAHAAAISPTIGHQHIHAAIVRQTTIEHGMLDGRALQGNGQLACRRHAVQLPLVGHVMPQGVVRQRLDGYMVEFASRREIHVLYALHLMVERAPHQVGKSSADIIIFFRHRGQLLFRGQRYEFGRLVIFFHHESHIDHTVAVDGKGEELDRHVVVAQFVAHIRPADAQVTRIVAIGFREHHQPPLLLVDDPAQGVGAEHTLVDQQLILLVEHHAVGLQVMVQLHHLHIAAFQQQVAHLYLAVEQQSLA